MAVVLYGAGADKRWDESIGRIQFHTFEWGIDEDGNQFEKDVYPTSHICSKEELGLEGDNSDFMPAQEYSLAELNILFD